MGIQAWTRLSELNIFARSTVRSRTSGNVTVSRMLPAPVTSISSRGLFIETDRPATEGEILSVLIGLLPDGKPPLEIDVQVVRVQSPNQAERGGLEVQFVGATAEQRARLEAYLRGLRGPHR